jgi:uncharacterized caspase-like protein
VKSRDVQTTVRADIPKEKPKAHILAIGIDNYSNSHYNLSYCVEDATDLSHNLKKNLPYSDIEATLLLDESATRESILQAVGKLKESSRPEDTVIVTYAGHGMSYGGKFFLIPHDLGPEGENRTLADEELARRGVSDDDLERAFRDLDGSRFSFVLDACHSGKALEAEEWRVGPMNSRGLAQLAWEKGMDILTASQSDQAAQELAALGHGLLTKALLDGLVKAPVSESGDLLSRPWLDYAASEVPRLVVSDDNTPVSTKAPSPAGDGKPRTVSLKRLVERVFESESAAAGGKTVRPIQTPKVFHRREGGTDWVVVRKGG